MTQQRKLTRKEKMEKSRNSGASAPKNKKPSPGFSLKLSLGLLAAAIGFLLYIGTVSYGYVLDDYSVIKENFVVQKGLSGIGTILNTSYRYGYWASNDELYRPLSLVMFAAEWQFFPDSPAVGHFMNVLLYALTGLLLFNLLCRLFKDNYLISFITTLLFLAHPVHTEVVANIKGRDEILSFLFIILTIKWLLDYTESRKISKIILSVLAFFLALMAKESALTMLAVIPVLLFVFKDFRSGKAVQAVLPLGLAAAAYLAIRASVLHGIIHTKAIAVLDNVLVGAPDFISRIGTAVYVLGRYLWLLVFPNHLSMDYSINEITILPITDYRVLVSLAIYLGLLIYAIYTIRKKETVSFGILFYLLTMAIVSNIFIVIGTVMADRLLYLPSLGFCLVVAVLLTRLLKTEPGENKLKGVADFMKRSSKPLIAACLLLALYSFKTIDRIPVWKSNWSLYQSGVIDSPNSSRCHYLVGVELKNVIAKEEKDSVKQVELYKRSIAEFKKAIELHPGNFDAYRDMGRSYDALGDTSNALASYSMALSIFPRDTKAMNNKGTILFRRQQYAAAKDLFAEAIRWDPRYSDALQNLGSCYGVMGDYENALNYLFKSLLYEKDKEKVPGTYYMIGMTYRYMGNEPKAQEFLTKQQQAQAEIKK